MGRTSLALQVFVKAGQTHPDSPKPHLKIGNLYIREKNRESQEQAAKSFREAIRIDPACKEGFNNLGVIAMRSGKADQAASYFEKALKIDEEFTDAHLNMGILSEEIRKNRIMALYHYGRYVQLKGKRSAEVRKWIQDLEKK